MSNPIYDIKDCNKIKIYDKETGNLTEEIERIYDDIVIKNKETIDLSNVEIKLENNIESSNDSWLWGEYNHIKHLKFKRDTK